MILAIYGTGGSGKELFERIKYIKELGDAWPDMVFIDDTKRPGFFCGCEMLPFEQFYRRYNVDEVRIAIAVGEPSDREILYNRVRERGYKLATIIDPTAKVAKSAVIGEGVIIKDDVSISSDAVIKDNVYINGMAMIGHNAIVGEHSQISSYSAIAGYVKVGKKCFVGILAGIRDRTTVGDNCIVSMGAIVLKDVPKCKVVMGNPARAIAENTSGLIWG